ncbi:MAG: carbohydrate kinase [Firmicutes bacterium]|nr:carbohydrate kinase [Bacillota bacterium]
MKILCIGNASYDITLPVSNFPKENTKTRIGTKIECGGGPASNAAYLLAKWGIDASFAGVVGNDTYGLKIKEEFEKIGVDTTYLELSKKAKTTESYIIANTTKATRTILTSKAKNTKYTYNLEKSKDEYDAILVDGEELEFSIEAINNNKKALKMIDAGRVRESTIKLCSLVDYVVCSKDFAENFTNQLIDVDDIKSLISVHQELTKSFNNNVIITLEEKGCFIFDGEYYLVPSIKVKAVDTTGAGDIYHGALLYFLVNNYPLYKAAHLANITGALSTLTIGGRYSCPDLTDVIERSKKYDTI